MAASLDFQITLRYGEHVTRKTRHIDDDQDYTSAELVEELRLMLCGCYLEAAAKELVS